MHACILCAICIYSVEYVCIQYVLICVQDSILWIIWTHLSSLPWTFTAEDYTTHPTENAHHDYMGIPDQIWSESW